jgi:cobalamin biosynthesis Co2+ chelatase CbiK
MNDGFTHLAVLSLHTIPGEEFHELYQNAQLFGQMVGGFEKILVARPLLFSLNDRGQKDSLALIIISIVTLVSCLQMSNELWYSSF